MGSPNGYQGMHFNTISCLFSKTHYFLELANPFLKFHAKRLKGDMPFLRKGYEFPQKQACYLTVRNFTFVIMNNEFLLVRKYF